MDRGGKVGGEGQSMLPKLPGFVAPASDDEDSGFNDESDEDSGGEGGTDGFGGWEDELDGLGGEADREWQAHEQDQEKDEHGPQGLEKELAAKEWWQHIFTPEQARARKDCIEGNEEVLRELKKLHEVIEGSEAAVERRAKAVQERLDEIKDSRRGSARKTALWAMPPALPGQVCKSWTKRVDAALPCMHAGKDALADVAVCRWMW